MLLSFIQVFCQANIICSTIEKITEPLCYSTIKFLQTHASFKQPNEHLSVILKFTPATGRKERFVE